MLFTLLALPFAQAADLRLVLERTGQAPVAVTYSDVQPGSLPSISLPASPAPAPATPAGRTRRSDPALRVEIDANPLPLAADCADCQPEVRLAVRLVQSEGGRDTVVSAPVITAIVGQQAMVKQGARVPLKQPDGTVVYETRELSLQLLYTSDTPPAAP